MPTPTPAPTLPPSAARRTSGPGTLARLLAGLADGWRAWEDYRSLSAMGDVELARLDLARGDIARRAVFGPSVR